MRFLRTERHDLGSSGVSPSHAGEFQAFRHDLLAGGFNDAAAHGTAMVAVAGEGARLGRTSTLSA